MRKLTSILVMLMFLVSLASINVHAQEGNDITTDAVAEQETQDIIDESVADDPTLEDVGTTPDQAGYGLKTALEKIRLALTFNRAKKAEVALQFAELRVKEARLMVAKNNLEALERSRIEHKKYIELAERNLEGLDGNERAIKTHVRLEVRLEEQINQVDELESLILIKAKGLTEEQKAKLLALIEEFRNQNDNIEVKIKSKKDSLKIRLKARGLDEDEIEDEFEEEFNKTKLTREEIIERKAQHQINQAEKMYVLASRLIEKAQGGSTGNETNTTRPRIGVTNRTLELHAKAKTKLDEAKSEFEAKHFFVAVELAHASKKLSALTIASIHGGVNERALNKRLEELEEEEREVEVEIKGNRAKVEVKVPGIKVKFILDTTVPDEIISEIARRTGLSATEIASIIKFEVEEEGKEEEDDNESNSGPKGPNIVRP